MLDSHARTNPLDDLEPVTDAATVAKLVEIVARVHVSPAGAAVRRRADHRDPPLARPPARRLAAGDAAPGPRRQGRGRDGRARLRRPRRRAGARRSRCSRTGCCRRSRRRWAAAPRPPRSPPSSRAVPDARATSSPDRRARDESRVPRPHHPRPGVRVLRRHRGRLRLAARASTTSPASGVLLLALPAPDRRASRPAGRHRLGLVRTVQPTRVTDRAAGHGPARAEQREPHPHRAAAARGAGALRARRPPPVRGRPDGLAVAPRGHLHAALRRPGPLHDRPDDRARHRPVRPGRARPHLRVHDDRRGHPARARRSRRSRWRACGPGPATTVPATSRAAAPRTSPSASTAAATTSAACTGAPARTPAS